MEQKITYSFDNLADFVKWLRKRHTELEQQSMKAKTLRERSLLFREAVTYRDIAEMLDTAEIGGVS